MKKIFSVWMLSLAVLVLHAQLPDINKAKADAAASTGANAGKLLTQFGNAIKTTSLLSSFAGQKAGWLAKAAKVADAASMASSVASLAGGIKPSMFKTGFDVNSIINAASTVKTMSAAGGLLKSLSGGLKPEALTSSFAAQKPAWETALSMLK
ncbi:MAG TPA: hypothetical protein VL307_03320 [Chitinophagaceae bacterium]|nr:hypothetical protein [Chitinophagaceae bacterium]